MTANKKERTELKTSEKEEIDKKYDKIMKIVILRIRIFAEILFSIIDEFAGMTIGEIVAFLEEFQRKRNGGKLFLTGDESEDVSLELGNIITDILITLPVPGKDDEFVSIAIENQVYLNKSISNRLIHNHGRVIDRQRKNIKDKRNYSDLIRTYCIWFGIHPVKELEDKIVFMDYVFRDQEGREILPAVKKAGVIVGLKSGSSDRLRDILGTVFDRNMTIEERIAKLDEKYQINIDGWLFKEVDEVYSPYDGAVEWGIDITKVEIAKNFLSDGFPDEIVSKNTGLDLETVKQLRAEL